MVELVNNKRANCVMPVSACCYVTFHHVFPLYYVIHSRLSVNIRPLHQLSCTHRKAAVHVISQTVPAAVTAAATNLLALSWCLRVCLGKASARGCGWRA